MDLLPEDLGTSGGMVIQDVVLDDEVEVSNDGGGGTAWVETIRVVVELVFADGGAV